MNSNTLQALLITVIISLLSVVSFLFYKNNDYFVDRTDNAINNLTVEIGKLQESINTLITTTNGLSIKLGHYSDDLKEHDLKLIKHDVYLDNLDSASKIEDGNSKVNALMLKNNEKELSEHIQDKELHNIRLFNNKLTNHVNNGTVHNKKIH